MYCDNVIFDTHSHTHIHAHTHIQVGPYGNPQENFEYYSLPYCAPNTKHHPDNDGGRFNERKHQTMAESLAGYALRHSGHDIYFNPWKEIVETCTTDPLSDQQAHAFAHAIMKRWFYQWFLDDLPVWGMVGESLPNVGVQPQGVASHKDTKHDLLLEPFIYTKRILHIHYNGNQIIQVDLINDHDLIKVEPGIRLTFTLSVYWIQTTEKFEDRFDRYLDFEYFRHSVTSLVMILVLAGIVALILLRTLRKDLVRYGIIAAANAYSALEGGGELSSSLEQPLNGGDKDEREDSGWKQVQGDVFRSPSYLVFLSALIGTGWQLIFLALAVILWAILSRRQVQEQRGGVLMAIVVCFNFTSIIAGYVSSRFFTTYDNGMTTDDKLLWWKKLTGLTVFLLPATAAVIHGALNLASFYHGTLSALFCWNVVKVSISWACLSVPLCVLGSWWGRSSVLEDCTKNPFDRFPCRVNETPRPIPQNLSKWSKPVSLIPLAGLFAFASIFAEIDYVLSSMWNYKFYFTFGYLLMVYCILALVVSLVSIIAVYICLNAENHHWQWTSFGSGASTAVYFFVRSALYVFNLNMHGLYQAVYYFGYMAFISICLGLLCGALAHGATHCFVVAIYRNLKVD